MNRSTSENSKQNSSAISKSSCWNLARASPSSAAIPARVGEDDFYIDLLFYHLRLRAFVVIDLKTGPFKPEYAGKLNFYCNVVMTSVRPISRPTIRPLDLIFARTKATCWPNTALLGIDKPIGISTYELTRALPKEMKSALPTVEEIEAELSDLTNETTALGGDKPGGSMCRESRAHYGTGSIAIVPAPFDAAHGADTPFGHRWGGEIATLSPEHLAALTKGKTLALDVRDEYVLFVKADQGAAEAAEEPERGPSWRWKGRY